MRADSTVYVVEDDAGARDSLRFLVDSVGLSVEAYDSAEAFLAAFDPRRRACVVADVRMPGISGLELQELLNERASSPPVILVTGHADVPMAVRALKAGAYDFLEKPFREQDIIDLIRRALEADGRRRERQRRERELALRYDSLTARETEVFALVAAGAANKVIASQLGLSQKTVEVHRAHVMDKMKARSLAHLVVMAVALGVVPDAVLGLGEDGAGPDVPIPGPT